MKNYLKNCASLTAISKLGRPERTQDRDGLKQKKSRSFAPACFSNNFSYVALPTHAGNFSNFFAMGIEIRGRVLPLVRLQNFSNVFYSHPMIRGIHLLNFEQNAIYLALSLVIIPNNANISTLKD